MNRDIHGRPLKPRATAKPTPEPEPEDPPRYCANPECGALLVRRQYPRQMETVIAFQARHFCGKECGANYRREGAGNEKWHDESRMPWPKNDLEVRYRSPLGRF